MYNSDWFNSLIKPFLSPPDWLFAPAWGFLYVTIFVAFVLFWLKPELNKKSGYILFFIQAILNLMWAPVFFWLKNIVLSVIVIVFLDIFVFFTIKKFHSVSKIAAMLMIPYFLWILYATYLNIGYLLLNLNTAF